MSTFNKRFAITKESHFWNMFTSIYKCVCPILEENLLPLLKNLEIYIFVNNLKMVLCVVKFFTSATMSIIIHVHNHSIKQVCKCDLYYVLSSFMNKK